MSIAFLKSITVLKDIVNMGFSSDYASIISRIWRPNPGSDKERETKELVKSKMPELYEKICNYMGKEQQTSLVPVKEQVVSYTTFRPFFKRLDASFKDARSRMKDKAIETSNPFLTISIEDTFDSGKKFQVIAKIASSVETKWGNWIEQAIPIFNKSILYIGAGGFDYILNDVVYDVKSGPRVMNKDQVEEAKMKHNIINSLSESKDLSEMIRIRDFKVALAYGKESIAGIFMRNSEGLMLFGADTWEEITGDEWNAYRLYLWSIRHSIEKTKKSWNTGELEGAVIYFLNSFYDDHSDKLQTALSLPEYKELERIVK